MRKSDINGKFPAAMPMAHIRTKIWSKTEEDKKRKETNACQEKGQGIIQEIKSLRQYPP